MAFIIESLDNQLLVQGTALVLVLIFVFQFFKELTDGFPYWHLPLVGRSRWELSNSKAKARFVHSAKELLREGFREVCGA